jgi:hypothetical protein
MEPGSPITREQTKDKKSALRIFLRTTIPSPKSIKQTTMPFYKANSPLLTSGLLVSVQIVKTN